jgi:hypothetical protein
MMSEERLKDRVERLLEEAGLSGRQVTAGAARPWHSADDEVVFEVGSMHLRFVRDRGQEFMDVGAASTPGLYHQFGDVDVAMGWKTVDQAWSQKEPEPLASVLQRVRSHYPELESAFSGPRVPTMLLQLAAARHRRGLAFADRLRRLAREPGK